MNVSEDVLKCLEVNRRYIEQKMKYLDNLMDEVNYLESCKSLNIEKIMELREDYKRELDELKKHKDIYDGMIEQTKQFVKRI